MQPFLENRFEKEKKKKKEVFLTMSIRALVLFIGKTHGLLPSNSSKRESFHQGGNSQDFCKSMLVALIEIFKKSKTK